MKRPIWHEYDYKVASDYSQGTPEEIRSSLRHQLEIPEYLPGEKTDDNLSKRHKPQYSFADFIKRKMQGSIQ
jgi:hypothetical protein